MLPVQDRYLVAQFFEEIRAAADGRLAVIGSSDILYIAGDPSLRAEFRIAFRGLNDPDSRALVKDYLVNVINDLDEASDRAEIKVDLLDRAALAPSASVVAAGILALIAAPLAAPIALGAGIVGVIASGAGRTWLRTGVQRNKTTARKIKQLLDSL